MSNTPDRGAGSTVSPGPPTVHDDVNGTPSTIAGGVTPSDAYERWSKLPRPRGRQPRDPHGQSVRFHCRDADEMECCLRDYLDGPTVPAEHATIEFVFPVAAAFMVYAADFKNHRTPGTEGDKQGPLYGKLDRTAISVIDALASTENPKDQMRRQKAIAKVCVEAVEKADGFRYSFHNNWLSREDEACRFSYFCNDSTLNKGRAANEGAGMVGKKMRKPVYNCQGLIAVKFSSTRQSLEVHYKHVPLHKTYAERAPPPRRDSKRRKIMEVIDPESLPVDKRRRKSTEMESLTIQETTQHRMTEPITTAVNVRSVGSTRQESLQPLVEFLGSASSSEFNEAQASENVDGSRRGADPELAARTHPAPTATAPASQGAGPAKSNSKRPKIPGTMAGSVQNGHLNWSAKSSTQTKPPSRSAKRIPSKTTTVLPGITEAASAAPAEASESTNIALSELEALKRKLEEAEERIRRLESEKSTTVPPPPSGPPQHVLWPPPPGYHPTAPYPYSNPSSPYPPLPASQGQIRFQPPPQRPFPPMPSYDQSDINNTPISPSNPAPYVGAPLAPASMSTPPPPPSSAGQQRPANPSRTIITKFKFYTPTSKTKQTVGRANTPTTTATATNAATTTRSTQIVSAGADGSSTLDLTSQ